MIRPLFLFATLLAFAPLANAQDFGSFGLKDVSANGSGCPSDGSSYITTRGDITVTFRDFMAPTDDGRRVGNCTLTATVDVHAGHRVTLGPAIISGTASKGGGSMLFTRLAPAGDTGEFNTAMPRGRFTVNDRNSITIDACGNDRNDSIVLTNISILVSPSNGSISVEKIRLNVSEERC